MSVLVAGEPPFPMQPTQSLSLLSRYQLVLGEEGGRSEPVPCPLSPVPKGVLHRRQVPSTLSWPGTQSTAFLEGSLCT